jgi:hypothetical protein
LSDSPTIAISPSLSAFFEQAIQDAIKARQLETSDAATHYLVALLSEYAHPDEAVGGALSQPLAFQLRDAMDASGTERFRRLRTLGDGVLYALGFFGGHVELRGVDRGYMVTVGSTAYDHAAAMLRVGGAPRRRPAASSDTATPGSGPDVLAELAIKFDRFVEVVSEVADGVLACAARDGRSIVKLYERWVKTGSSRLAEELGARGIVPVRSSGGGLN